MTTIDEIIPLAAESARLAEALSGRVDVLCKERARNRALIADLLELLQFTLNDPCFKMLKTVTQNALRAGIAKIQCGGSVDLDGVC